MLQRLLIGSTGLGVCILLAAAYISNKSDASDVLEEQNVMWLPLEARSGGFDYSHDALFLQSHHDTTALENFGNTVYFSRIRVGTPAKTFKVVMDTGSAILWVPDKVCRDVACKNHRSFRVHDSSTGKVLGVQKRDGRQFVPMGTVQYGSGGMEGVFASDKVSIAGVTVDMALLVATHVSTEAFVHAPFDGICGVGRHGHKTEYNGHPMSFMQAAVAQKKISKNVISFYLPMKPGGRGAVVVGGVSKKLYVGALNWHPTLKVPLPMWVLDLTTFRVGDGSNLCAAGKGCVAVVDTGTSLLITSEGLAKAANSHLGVSPNCKKLHKAPPVHFKFAGGANTYSLPAHALTLEAKTPKGSLCSPAIRPMSAASGSPRRNLLGNMKRMMHHLGAGAKPANKWTKITAMFGGKHVVILGDVFLRHFYSAFDNSDPSKSKVGFAKAAPQHAMDQQMIRNAAEDFRIPEDSKSTKSRRRARSKKEDEEETDFTETSMFDI